MNIRKSNSVQEWLPFKEILKNGILKLKDDSLIKILEIKPINFILKSKLEKDAILNSYKTFLKTCNFDIQILIQSNKEDLSKHFSQIKNNNKNEEKNIIEISKKYINYIQEINRERKSSSKKYFIILKEFPENKKDLNFEKILYEKLNDKYFKIKECLSRCGNTVICSDTKESTERIINSFINTRKEL